MSNNQHSGINGDSTSCSRHMLMFVPEDKVDIWALVLLSRSIAFRIVHEDERSWFEIPFSSYERALKEISSYEEENESLHGNGEVFVKHEVKGFWGPFLVFFAVMAFLMSDPFGLGLMERGAADAQKIRSGEFWRLATALTLHVDPVHLLSNMGIGAILLWSLCAVFGNGFAWFLALISGLGGNFLNGLIVSLPHVSVGASTAVMGMVGVIASLRVSMYRASLISSREAIAPLAAGAALLAMMGTGGEHSDISAHLFGFTAGIFAGLGAGRYLACCGRPGQIGQWILGACSLFFMLCCWFLALMP